MNAMLTRLARRFVVSPGLLCGLLPAGLCLLTTQPALSQDVGFVAVMKGQEFYQASADIVSIGEWRTWHETGEVQNEGEHWEPPHVFETFAIGTAMDAIVSGTVIVPGGEEVDLVMDFLGDEDDPEIGVENGYDSPLELDTARPDGSYTVQLVTGHGVVDVPLSLTGGAYPPVPHVTNFTALQSADASAPITIQWAAMGGTSNDFIQVSVSVLGGEDDGFIVWESAMPGDASALDGTDTAVNIPAGALQPGTDYQAELLFVKTTDVKSSPALSVAGYYKLTGFLLRTAALAGQPLGAEFVRANPLDGWWVPRNSAVAFHFSHPMNPNFKSIAWTNNGYTPPGFTFTYHWTQDNTVLLCEPNTDLPQNREIGWTLNLSGFRDAAGFQLSGTASGSFHTEDYAAGISPEVDFIAIFKTRSFLQTGTAPVAEGRYEAVVETDANAPNRLLSASITSQENGRTSPLYGDPWNGEEYEAPGEYASKTDLDRFYPNGSYQFSLTGLADGFQNVTVDLGTADQYPDAPVIANLAALQAADPNQDITVNWQGLPDWTNDFESLEAGAGLVEFEIIDEMGWDIFWIEADKMEDGVSCTIPAGTLEPGRSYQAYVYFMRITDIQETASGSIAVAAFESQTTFTIKTGGRPDLPAVALQRIGDLARIQAGGGKTFFPYVLEASSDLKRWTLLDTYWNQEEGYIYQFDDLDAQYLKSRFYRVGEYLPGTPTQPPVSIQGTVWTSGSHTTPVAGATVGTDLDGRTTVTDAQGRFFLITDTPSMGGLTDYTITITSGAQTKDYGPFNWGDQPRGQVFDLD